MPNKRVMVVEDDADTLAALVLLLAGEGFDVLPAASGPEALCAFLNAWVENKPVRAVILDCAMWPLDGFTVAQTIRLWEHNSRFLRPVKMAFYTAYPETVERTTLLRAVGADLYLRKPADSWKLPALVSSWLEREEQNGDGKDSEKRVGDSAVCGGAPGGTDDRQHDA